MKALSMSKRPTPIAAPSNAEQIADNGFNRNLVDLWDRNQAPIVTVARRFGESRQQDDKNFPQTSRHCACTTV